MDKPVVTPEAVQRAQGTRLDKEHAPWETYSAQMDFDPDMTPQLAAEVAEYSQKYHDKSSSQNEEELAYWKEINQEAAKEYQWCKKEEYSDEEARMGKIMHSSELISILRNKCNIKCWYRDHPQSDKLTLVVQSGMGILPPEVGCWVQRGWMPEYTIMGFDDKGIPLAERYRGWRTCCLQLLLKGIITEDQINKVFGRAERSCASKYNSIIYSWRNRGHEYEN